MWTVLKDNKKEKSYPFKIQAVVYCYLKGYVYSGMDDWNGFESITVLDPSIKIIEEK